MPGTVLPAGALAPHEATEDEHGQKKENSNHFKPKGVADAGEGAQETEDAAGQSAAGAGGRLAGFAGCRSGGGKLVRGLDLTRGLGLGGETLAGDAASDAQSDAEGTSYGLRSHPYL